MVARQQGRGKATNANLYPGKGQITIALLAAVFLQGAVLAEGDFG